MAVKDESPAGEVMMMVVRVVPEPEASAKRPVPPVIVKLTVSWNSSGLDETIQDVPFPETKTSSPLAEVIVSFSVPTNPPHPVVPMAVVVPTSFDLPRWLRWTMAVMLFVVIDVAVPLPDMLPLNGVEWVASAAGNRPTIITTDRIVENRISLFILS